MIDARSAGGNVPRPKTLLVASGKGGVGTSVIAALTAITAAERGDRVLLVDGSEGGGTLHHLFGVRPTHSLWMLTDSEINPNDAVIAIDANLSLVAGGTSGTSRTALPPSNDTDRRAALANVAQLYGQFDFVVFDGGSRLDTITAASDVASPSVLLVTSADRLALAANYALVKSISARRAEAPIAVMANRHGEALAQEACEFLVGACAHFLSRSIDVIGAIPDDACLHAAVGAGMTLLDALDGSPAADAVRAVLSRLLPSPRSAPRPMAFATSSFSLPISSRRWS
jgi:MinD-like ATPase involved in chromosome partitioning or flagellar assembly